MRGGMVMLIRYQLKQRRPVERRCASVVGSIASQRESSKEAPPARGVKLESAGGKVGKQRLRQRAVFVTRHAGFTLQGNEVDSVEASGEMHRLSVHPAA